MNYRQHDMLKSNRVLPFIETVFRHCTVFSGMMCCDFPPPFVFTFFEAIKTCLSSFLATQLFAVASISTIANAIMIVRPRDDGEAAHPLPLQSQEQADGGRTWGLSKYVLESKTHDKWSHMTSTIRIRPSEDTVLAAISVCVC